MDTVLNAQFDRVQAALSTLVESIATFNPSPQAALELKAADDQLCSGLQLLSRHQDNQRRILALRSEADRLEAQLRSSVGTLASLRHELLEAAPSETPTDARSVPATELLQYAQSIAVHTVPPTYREPIAKGVSDAAEDKAKDETISSGVPTNSLPSPAFAGVAASATTEDANKTHNEPEVPIDVTPQQAEWLKALRGQNLPWVPWPSDDKIRFGNLMQIQRLLDQKKDPWAETAATEQQPEEDKPAEPQITEPEHHIPHRAPERQDHAHAHAPPAPEAPRVFQGFVDYDDDDD